MAAGAAGGDPGDSAFRISGSSASFPKLGLECWHIRGCFSSASCGCSPSLLRQTWLRNVACPPGTSQWWSASHPLWRYRASSPGTGPKACFFLLIHRGNAYYKTAIFTFPTAWLKLQILSLRTNTCHHSLRIDHRIYVTQSHSVRERTFSFKSKRLERK